ncbi:unnamed protein product [Paramecium sonneborni]|uniref:glycerophosphodiester phosphodiesterase n=1 Tax=Paramecium sonneborni TaxID=65129 RepID=A0A8S1R9C8_9CILI|nr:unnamed protein product [Paramecium sonneborni]
MYYLIFLVCVAFSSISPADYISQSDRPKIAAHRGLCSIFPENTAQSFEGAMFQGTDFIELDVVLNKELQLIVAHDTFMSAVSNIKQMTEYSSRQRKRTINGQVRDDWWLIDFSIDELKRVGINQVRGSTRPKMFDGLFTYPTLWEVLTQVKNFNNRTANQRNPNKKPVGILLEIKDYQYHLEYAGVSIVELVIDELQRFGIGTIKDCKNVVPIVIMSFDMNAIKASRELTDLPRVFLMTGLQNQPSTFYAEATKYTNIIGVDLASVWNQKTQTTQPEVQLIKDNQMMVYAWTFQDDNSGTQNMFNSTIAKGIYYQAVKMNIHGLITEFPDVAIQYVQLYQNQ